MSNQNETSSDGASGAQRAAAFLLSLEKTVSADVMRNLDPKVVSKIAEAMTDLNPELCSVNAVDGLYRDLARTFHERTGVRAQDDFELYGLLESSYGDDEANRVITEIHDRRRREQPFAFLETASSSLAARVLKEESPGVVGLILSHVAPATSADVLATFDDETTLEIVRRMTTVTPPGIETMLTIADDLQERMRAASLVPAPRAQDDSLRTVADMLTFADSEVEHSVLTGLEAEDDVVASQVREFMFTWEDLAAIEKRAMQKILASVDTKTLSIALKACSGAVFQNIMDNLSSRVREMVIDEKELLGAMPMNDVLMARSEIMDAVRALMDSGEFSPARAGEELVD
ncbi:MAG: FliG C-terminal domain-containing protein [Planctomycetota bacterium]|nr:FliG C-terminal domain-containing protein [Planctomycetota bacterium]MDG1984778.1 FliG C-terminal domain-containing protein [Planctomycetota bacterium]